MSKTTLGFLFTGLVYLVIGVTLGVLFFIIPETRPLKSVHIHLNLVGFVIFTIFGIGYHILPRFRGNPLFSERLAWWQFWLANVGLVGLVVYLGLGAYLDSDGVRVAQVVFGSTLALSIYLFVYNMLRTLLGK
ncbi:MAG: cbb3-type cytochrome c oxidase subunit I [Chloroflexi bacterium]|nr:cbb3-type cytochrome c oxidase subunit I [Chloroflexota bacterium]